MASQQTRIAALLDQLAGLGDKRTGMPIDADDWNRLVTTIRGTLEVAAAQDAATSGALDQRYAPADHEHLAQVTIEWLDATLRAAVGTGSAAPSVTATVAGAHLGAQVNRLLDEVGRVRIVLEDQQARIDRSVTSDIDRTKDVSDLRTQVAAVNDLRGVVTGLEGRLRTAAAQLDELDSLRASLTDAAGARIDVGALQTSVTELSRLRENLTDGQGNLVRMRDVLARLDEQHALDPGANLDGRFEDLRNVLDSRLGEQLTAAETRLGATADERAAQLRDDLTTQVDRSVADARADIQQSTDARVGAAEQRLTATVATVVQDATAGLGDTLTGQVRAQVRDGLAGVDARITSAVDAARVAVGDGLRAELNEAAATAAAERAGALVAPLSQQVSGLATRLDGLDAAVDASVSAAVDARMDQLLTDVDARAATRFDEARAALAQSMSAEVDRAVDARVGDLDAKVSVAVDRRLADVDTRIDQRVAIRTAALTEQVRTEVGTQIRDLNVAGQLDTMENRITTAMRAEIGAAETREEANRSTALTELATRLRTENEASQVGLETRMNSRFRVVDRPDVIIRPGG